jgi:hypothetical protein
VRGPNILGGAIQPTIGGLQAHGTRKSATPWQGKSAVIWAYFHQSEEENGSTDQIFRLANASPWNAFLPVFRLPDVGDQVTCHRRFDEPRADGIDVNVIGASSTAVDFVSMMTPAFEVL